jgi:hypothetical protein
MKDARYQTEALAFSPDDKRLAVTTTDLLLVIDVHSPATNVRQFDVQGTCGVSLAWNESSDALLVCGTLLRLADGASCVVKPSPHPSSAREFSAYGAFWLDSEHVVLRSGEILDLACRHVGKWQLEPTWYIGAVAASKGWVLLEHSEGQGSKTVCEYSIMDRASHCALNGWTTRKLPCGVSRMAEGAEALCTDGERLHCWAINGGKEIPVPRQVRGYRLNQAATSSARVIAEKWEYDRGPWWDLLLTWRVPVDWPVLPRRRVVFDLRSGNRISSWRPRIQDSTNPFIEGRPYHCALSANGEFLAESGDGRLELYRLTP